MLEWSSLSTFLEQGFAYVRPTGDLTDLPVRLLDLCERFYNTPLEVRAELAAYRSTSLFGYYPSEAEARNKVFVDAPVFHGRKKRGYSSFDFMVSPELLRHPEFTSVPWAGYQALKEECSSAYRDMQRFANVVALDLYRFLWSRDVRLKLETEDVESDLCCSSMRLLQYAADEDRPISKPHTDYELFSLIAASEGGLMVGEGESLTNAFNGEGWFTVLAGDMMQVLSRGVIRSVLHGVMNEGIDRHSVVFFNGLPFAFEAVYAGSTIKFGEHLLGMLIRSNPQLSRQLSSGQLRLEFPVPEVNPFKFD